MANFFDWECYCLANWRFEPGTLAEDSQGANDLIEVWPGTPPWSVTPGLEGDGMAGFSGYSTPYAYKILDASLDENFPFRSSNSENLLSFCGWYYATEFAPGSYYRGGPWISKRSWDYGAQVTTGFDIYLAYAIPDGYATLKILLGTGSQETFNTGIQIVNDYTYHFGIIIDGDTPSLYVRVYCQDTDTMETYAATPTGPVLANAEPLGVGYNGSGPYDFVGNSLNGCCDEFVIFNRVLTADEIDAIRAGTYEGLPCCSKLMLIYPSGDPFAEASYYCCPKNYDYGHKPGWIDTDDRQRGQLGGLKSLTGARKKKFKLPFTCCTRAQLDALTAIWALKGKVDLYLNGVDFDAIVKIMTPPIATSVAAFDPAIGAETYSFDLFMEEV